MREEWHRIPGFPTYDVSSLGRVKNNHTDHTMRLTVNQRGIVYVGLMKDGVQYKRSVALIVASCFLHSPIHESFDSVIHLNGDRTDCRAGNLMYRPHHFTINYMRQFQTAPVIYNGSLYCPETDELFANSYDMATKYGLLLRDVHAAIVNGHMIWPTKLTVQAS